MHKYEIGCIVTFPEWMVRLKNMFDSIFFNRQFGSEPQICPDRSREFEILGACHRSKQL